MTQLLQLPSAEVAAYGAHLRRSRPSAQLDERIALAIERNHKERHDRAWRKINPRRIGPALAAGCAAVLTAGLILWLGGSVQREAPPAEVADVLPTNPLANDAGHDMQPYAAPDAFTVVPTGQYSLWPTDAAVFRVRANLDTLRAVSAALPAEDERQYWVDVRVANDGSMRIVRIVPVNE
ncbi:MAG TPA: hypothetical protein VFR59_04115 [Steroidobacteraceae bacterium]|nr:hypothetical protein [Steroidobacteraceae bacterium]